MKITKRQLGRIIRETLDELSKGFQGDVWNMVAEYLKHGDSLSAMNRILDHYMMDDTWRMEEDALEDLLINLGPNPTAEDIESTSKKWFVDYKAGKYQPKTKEEKEADWSRGAKPRTNYEVR